MWEGQWKERCTHGTARARHSGLTVWIRAVVGDNRDLLEAPGREVATGTAHPRKGWGETGVPFHSPKHVKQHCDGNFPTVFRKDTTSQILCNQSSFAIAREELLVAYDEETIDDEEFVFLLNKNISRNPHFPYRHYEEFHFKTMDPVECKAKFRVEKNALRSVAKALLISDIALLNWIGEN